MNSQSSSSFGKTLLATGLFLVSGAYAAWQHLSDQSATPTSTVTPAVTSETPPSSTPIATTPEEMPTTAPTTGMMGNSMMNTGKYRNGTYTGNATDAFYGIVQVQAVVQDGKLVAVHILQEPDDRGTTREISDLSLPILAQEAITVQSAKVSIISGATQTSEGFVISLESALVQAS